MGESFRLSGGIFCCYKNYTERDMVRLAKENEKTTAMNGSCMDS
jgi:hypothetical protein